MKKLVLMLLISTLTFSCLTGCDSMKNSSDDEIVEEKDDEDDEEDDEEEEEEKSSKKKDKDKKKDNDDEDDDSEDDNEDDEEIVKDEEDDNDDEDEEIPSVKKLVSNYSKTINNLEFAELQYNVNLNVNLSDGVDTITLNNNIYSDINIVIDDTDYTLEMDRQVINIIDNEPYETNSTVYIIGDKKGKKESVYFQYIEELGEWVTIPYNLNLMQSAFQFDNNFTLEEDLVKINGVKCYELHNDNVIYRNFVLSNILNCDIIKAEAIVYMSEETLTPVRVEVKLNDKDITDEIEGTIFESYASQDVTVKIKDCVLSVDFDSINKELDITVPMDEITGNKEEIKDEPKEEPTKKPEINYEDYYTTTTGVDESRLSDLNDLYDDNIQFIETIDFKNHTTKLLLSNINTKDVSYFVEAVFYKNNKEVGKSSRYYDIEAETFLVESLWCEEEFDNVSYNVSKETTYNELVGSEVDVYYTISEDRIYGTIENNTKDTLSFPIVRYVAFDKNSNIIDSGYSYASEDTVAPGESANYEIALYSDKDDLKEWYNFVVYVTATTE